MTSSTAGSPESPGFHVSGTAPESYERYISVIMAPFVDAVVARVGLTEGSAVLDVACGTGLAARAAAAVVGPAGRVVGLDVNAQMLATAAAVSAGSSPSIEWVEGSALDLRFAADSFDAVLCQQGIQSFDQARALAEMRRVTRKGGRVVVSFWSPLESQPYFRAQLDALERGIKGSTPPLVAGFALSPSAAREAFESAGFTNTEVEEVAVEIALPSFRGFLEGHIAGLPTAGAVAALPPEDRRAIFDEMATALAPYTSADGGARVPFSSYVVSGSA